MILSMSGQAVVFLITVVAGAVLGVLYDCFRILRRVLRHRTVATAVEDAMFWIFATLLMFVFLMRQDLSEIRSFIFIGLALGAILYFMALSRFFIKFAMMVLRWIKGLILVIISPVVAVCAIFKKRLKSGHKYVRMKGRKIYQRVRRRHGRQSSQN